jgi:hypothetical protein
MPIIYILKNIFSIKFFNCLDKILKHINTTMNLNWNTEIFNSNIEIDFNGNPHIVLYDYEYDIMNIHIFEVENSESISFIEYSVGSSYDYNIYQSTLNEYWNNIMTDIRKNYIKNKNIIVNYNDKSHINCKTICIQYTVNFSFKTYIFMYDIIYE